MCFFFSLLLDGLIEHVLSKLSEIWKNNSIKVSKDNQQRAITVVKEVVSMVSTI